MRMHQADKTADQPGISSGNLKPCVQGLSLFVTTAKPVRKAIHPLLFCCIPTDREPSQF